MGETLESALAAFGKQRSRLIADAIVELGREALGSFTPPDERTTVAFHAAWIEAARDPAKRTWCLEQLTAKLPKLVDGEPDRFGNKLEALMQRLAVLAGLAPDPRIARAMLARLELREAVTSFADVHTAMAKLIEQHADDGLADALRAPGLPRQVLALKLPGPVALSPHEAQRWAIVKPPQRHDTAAMLRAVYAAPRDDAPRAVLADALQEQGDPRGELIAIQLQEARGEATDAARARANELVKAHGKDWLGALRPVIYRAELRRGFIARIELAGSWASSNWEAHIADPSLATVEEFAAGHATAELLARFIAGSAARPNLRVVTIASNDVWDVVRATPLPGLERVICHDWKRGKYEQRFLADVLPFVEDNPRITGLGCSIAFTRLFSQHLLARLVELECRDKLPDAVGLWQQLPQLRSLRCNWPDEVELVRHGDEEFARVRPSTFTRDTGAWLAALPRHIQRVEVLGNAAFLRRAQTSVGRRFDLVPGPVPSGLVTGNKS